MLKSLHSHPANDFERHDGFSNTSSAIADAETSFEFRQDNSPSELISSYLAGTRRVSRSHLSHLYISSPSPDPSTRPLTPPASDSDAPTDAITNPQYTFLLCTPHYVADRKTLNLRLEELVSLLTSNDGVSENDVQVEINRARVSLMALQHHMAGTASALRTQVSPIKMKLPRGGRFQRSAIAAQEVVCR